MAAPRLQSHRTARFPQIAALPEVVSGAGALSHRPPFWQQVHRSITRLPPPSLGVPMPQPAPRRGLKNFLAEMTASAVVLTNPSADLDPSCAGHFRHWAMSGFAPSSSSHHHPVGMLVSPSRPHK